MLSYRSLGQPRHPLRVALAEDTELVFSDDYRYGWRQGFSGIGCDVQSFDVGVLRRCTTVIGSPYRSIGPRATVKGLIKQIAEWRPDLVWCHQGRWTALSGFAEMLRNAGVRTATYLCDEPYECGETVHYARHFDHVFTMDPCTIAAHQAARGGGNVWYLPPGVDTDRFVPLPYAQRSVPALFLGNADLVPRKEWFAPIEQHVPGARVMYHSQVRHGKHVSIGKGSPDWIPTEKHPELYGSCVVGLNVHRSPWITEECLTKRVRGPQRKVLPGGLRLCEDATEFGTGFWNDLNLSAAHVNPRFFEMAACGTLVVSDDHRFELARMFPFAPRASTPEHFLELVQHYIKHRDEAEVIGRACSFLISGRHSYRHRAAEVLVRAGLRDASEVARLSSLGPPEEWLTTQDFGWLRDASPSDLTGRSGSWSPALGMSLMERSGLLSAAI